VRERDNLPDGDISRTHRQQAVIDYVVWKLEHQGILTSLGQLDSLLSVAKQYIITDTSLNLAQFAGEMSSLTGRNLTFKTLPIKGFQTYYLGGTAEDANVIDIPAIKAEVKHAFSVPPAPTKHKKHKKHKKPPSYPLSATTADVYNAGYTVGLAGQVSAGLTQAGFTQGQVADYSTTQTTTQVLYGSGAAAQANAAKAAAVFGVTAQPRSSVAAGHIEVILGTSATLPSFGSLNSASSRSRGSRHRARGSTGAGGSAPNSFDNQGAVSVKANAPYGIPCIY
jgi:LytR cell envelope-related transcriptional attenuator